MFSENTDIIRIVNRFYTQYFFPICKLHDYGWKLFERKYKFFVNFFGTILIGKKYEMMIVEMKRLSKNNLSLESEIFV